MQAKADHQIAIAIEAQNLADSYRKAQEECSAGREKYLKTSQGARLLKRMLKEYFYAKKHWSKN